MRNDRLYLSAPNVSETEIERVVSALRSGWVAPSGPELTGFEEDIARFVGVPHAVALASGTAALHLGLKYLGVGPGDTVVVPTLTFGATAFAVTYVGAEPVFVDVEETSWNLDPEALASLLAARARQGQLPKAIVSVDLFGRPADYGSLLGIANHYGVPILEDAAEALGATAGAKSAGSFGVAGVFSFNGNKIMTTSGGGMLVTDNPEMADKVRFWSTQSREAHPWYEHEEIGYNYRLSNILAALGRGQLERLPSMINRRREMQRRYASGLEAGLPGVHVVGDPPWGRGNSWLTTVRFDPMLYPNAPTNIRLELDRRNIESRPIWKPLHMQPVFAQSRGYVTGVAERLFGESLCLPTGVITSDEDIDEVIDTVTKALGGPSRD
jgi:dTDP-4-amino-4,6-dideoxygalactose transaminase